MSASPLPSPPSPAAAIRLRARLLTWYRSAARDLPWRHTRDAYAIWISEVMLQQTRVETVLGYYRRFLERLPGIEDLASAGEEEVLALWSGLGYYRRARSLQAAARCIVEQHGGRFPSTRAQALELPGVGPYTAGAVLSIAYDQREPAVDGNVQRVFSRLFGVHAAAGSPALVASCWALAELLLPRRSGAGEWNQALMELGATVCTPRRPRCSSCPVVRTCSAHALGRQEQFPGPKVRRARLDVELELLLVERKGCSLLQRRPPGGRMGGLWQLPTRQVQPTGSAPLFPLSWPERLTPTGGEALDSLRHSITHHRIRALLIPGAVHGRLGRGLAWVEPATADSMALTGMTKKVLRRLQRGAIPAEGLQ